MPLTPYVCTNCGYWQRFFSTPVTCPVCCDVRHTPPDDGFCFLPLEKAAVEASTEVTGSDNVLVFTSQPKWGIGPSGYLLRHPDGNFFWESTGFYDQDALELIAEQGGIAWLSASHPHAYAALWQLQDRFEPEVAIHVADLEWTNALHVSYPFDTRIEPLPGLELIHTGGHFAGHCVLYWAANKILFAGDMLKFHFEDGHLSGLSTHKGFNRRIPMSHGEIERYRAIVAQLDFNTVYTTFESAPCTRDDALRLFDAQLAGKPFFGPIPFGGGT